MSKDDKKPVKSLHFQANGDKANAEKAKGDKGNGAKAAAHKPAGAKGEAAKGASRGGKRGGKKNNPHAPRSRARRRAVQALYQWQLNPENAGAIVSQFLDEQDFAGVDVEYFRDLLEGVEQHCAQIDEELGRYLDRVLDHVDPLERAILRLSTFEMVHRLEVPVRVVLDEAVELARRFGSEQGHAFVNGVLDPMAKKTRKTELAQSQTPKE